MHKRILDSRRLLPLLLLTTLLFPSFASAASQPVQPGSEQHAASTRLTNPSRLEPILDVGYLYTVVAGDDVWYLAVVHGISMETLVTANNLKEPYWLYPGDVLWIPADPVIVPRRPTPAPTPVPTPLPTPVATPTPAPVVVEAAPAETPAEQAQSEQPAEPGDAGQVEPALPPEAGGVITVSEAVVTAEVAAPQPSGMADGAKLIFDQMNEKRTARGLPALVWSDQLAAAAQAHADDCARRGWGSHVGSDGARLRTRLARVGYYPTYASENWANASNAQGAFNMWWWEGPGGVHYENIMGRNYSEVGIGVALSRWGYYYVVDFGKP